MLKNNIKYFTILALFLSFSHNTFAEQGHLNQERPMTHLEILHWYNNQLATIPELNLQWQKEGIAIQQRAKKAYDVRRNAITKARDMLQNERLAAEIRSRDMEKYGHPNGPTFDYWVNQYQKKGFQGKSLYETIVNRMSRPDTAEQE